MAVDRSEILDKNFLAFVEGAAGLHERRALDEPLRIGSGLTGRIAWELFESQVTARHLDLEARALRRRQQGFYTIGSAGHEGNVVLGRWLRPTDPTFLHYRSGALMAERARQVPGTTQIFDVLLSLAASREDPASGGRHKVFGSRELWVPPQTSTIASHLPKAVGCAFAIDRARRLEVSLPIPRDAIAMCSFGDASVNHSVAQTAFNAASWATHQSMNLPLLFVCEDNGIGISVRTPKGWVEVRLRSQPRVAYFRGDGLDLASAFDAAQKAVEYVRTWRRPAFLHLETVRLLGHAGSDVETEYRDLLEIEASEARDPVLATARFLIEEGVAQPSEVRNLYEELRVRVQAASQEAVRRPRLSSVEEIIAPLAPLSADLVMTRARTPGEFRDRVRLFGSEAALPERSDRPRHLAVQINRALLDGLAAYPEMLIFGEDVARKGGVYHVTTQLAQRAGVGRVFNTLLDETTILGLAIGAGHLGLLPVPEIQYLAYFHNAEDQVRGEACSLQYFSNGAFRNPMVIRIASFGYQKGFGGHFHNDNSIAALRDIPGLIIAAPARGDDAVLMLRTALAAAKIDGAVVAFLEPIALYMTKDLHTDQDGAWLSLYPGFESTVPVGKGKVYHEETGDDLTIVTYANGLWLSLRAARLLAERHGIRSRVVDLRWLAPLDAHLVAEQAAATGRVLIVDEGRRTGGVGEALMALLCEASCGSIPAISRVCSEDVYIPLGAAALEVMPSESKIVDAARTLVSHGRTLERSGG